MTRMRRKIHALALLGGVMALAACATVPPPTQLLARAQSELQAARNAGAANAAPDALGEAERRLAAAQQFNTNGQFGKATDSAQEAEAAAETARARAETARLNWEIRNQTTVNASLRGDLARRERAVAAAQQAATTPIPAPASSVVAPASAASAGQPLSVATGAASAPAPATSAAPTPAANGPVTLPSIQLGQPATPAEQDTNPAPASTSGGADQSGDQP